MKKIMIILITALLFGYSCNKTDDEVVKNELYNPTTIIEKIIEYNVSNLGSGLNSVFISHIEDSLSRAEFSQAIIQPLRYLNEHNAYFFSATLNGYLIADPSMPDELGTSGINTQDINGKYFVRDMIDMARYSCTGWVDYSFLNMLSGEVENKRTMVKLIPEANWFIGSGYYESTTQIISEMNLIEFKDFMYKELVLTMADVLNNIYTNYPVSEEAFFGIMREMLNHIRFDDGDAGYFYAYTMDGVLIGYGLHPEMVGENMIDYQDATGAYVVRDKIALLEEQGEGYLDYYWENPASGEIQKKRSFSKLLPELDIYIGSGYYQ